MNVLASSVRPATEADCARMREIEVAAGRAFRDLDMHAVAGDEALPVEALLAYVGDGRAWVLEHPVDGVIGYLLADVVDGTAHVEQVSVHPAHARRGLGRQLLAQAGAWARDHGSTAVTLTTFAHVPWNAPYYERAGFRRLTEEELTPGLRAIRRHEADLGLDAWPRVCMRWELEA